MHRGKILLVITSVLVTLLGVDLVLLALHGPVRVVEDFYEPDTRFGYRMRPNLEFIFASPYHGYRARVRTNDRGLRDDEVAVPKPPGVFRVLLLGDSMTAGLEVDRQDSFEAVCESRLRVHGPVEVVNAGVRGYNLDNVVGFLETEGMSYTPDAVVYFFCDNDLVATGSFEPAGSDISRGFTLRGVVGRLAAYSHITFRLEILRQMVAVRRSRDRAASASEVRIPGGLATLFTSSDYASMPITIMTARRIRFLAEFAAQQGAAFLLAGAPQRPEIDPETQRYWNTLDLGAVRPDFDGVRHYLDWIASDLRVERLDPVPSFRAELPRGEALWFHKDPHFTPSGHRLMGELLANKIEQLPSFQTWKRERAVH